MPKCSKCRTTPEKDALTAAAGKTPERGANRREREGHPDSAHRGRQKSLQPENKPVLKGTYLVETKREVTFKRRKASGESEDLTDHRCVYWGNQVP